jgi:putative transposase
MLTKSEFSAWCSRLKLSPEAVETIQTIRTSPPARKVQQNKMSVPGTYPTRKMGFAIQFESHTVEFPLIYKAEHDDDVLEIWCQPSTFELSYVSANGRLIRHPHTPDYFIIRRNGAGWIEAKDKGMLPVLSKGQPNRYRLVNGVWTCPPGSLYAERLGLTYSVHSSAEVTPVFARNATFMDDYLRDPPAVHKAVRTSILKHLELAPVTTLADLISELSELANRDDIYTLICDRTIHVDWNAHAFVEPEEVRLFASADTAEAFARATSPQPPQRGVVDIKVGSKLLWDGRFWTVANVGDNLIALGAEGIDLVEVSITKFEELLTAGRISEIRDPDSIPEHPEVAERVRAAGPNEIRVANKRFKMIQPYLDGRTSRDMSRTIRRWIASYKAALKQFGNGLVGLYPRTSLQGNRTTTGLESETRTAMVEHIKDNYETHIQGGAYACWSLFKTKREGDGLKAVSINTYLKAIENRPREEQAKKRGGSRVGYKQAAFVWQLEWSGSPHGDRPFEIAHIDHTELDIELISLKTGENLKRPWLTIMTDAHTRKFLGSYLTFDTPSARSCMMVMRDCVRRHGRLPQIIVVDGGKEFHSIYFDHLLAYYECTKKVRPGAKARFGSVCERLFGTTTSQLINNLVGNTQATKNVRCVTKSNDPKELAVWEFAGFLDRLESYMFDTYEILEHPALLRTPREAFAYGMSVSGRRLQRKVTFDKEFLINSSPSTRSGHVRIDAQRGVLVNGFRYWSDVFRGPGLNKKDVDVRFDPFDMGVAWVFVRGSWMECHSQYYSQMKGKTLKQVQIATELYRRTQSLSGSRRRSLTPLIIATMLNAARREEEIRRQQLFEVESQRSRIHLVTRTEESISSFAPLDDLSIRMKPSSDRGAVATAVYGRL